MEVGYAHLHTRVHVHTHMLSCWIYTGRDSFTLTIINLLLPLAALWEGANQIGEGSSKSPSGTHCGIFCKFFTEGMTYDHT